MSRELFDWKVLLHLERARAQLEIAEKAIAEARDLVMRLETAFAPADDDGGE